MSRAADDHTLHTFGPLPDVPGEPVKWPVLGLQNTIQSERQWPRIGPGAVPPVTDPSLDDLLAALNTDITGLPTGTLQDIIPMSARQLDREPEPAAPVAGGVFDMIHAEQANGAEGPASKPSNPKDLIGSSKLPLNLVPSTLMVYAAMSFAEGASKYGAYNWRIAGVRASIYKAALERHLLKWWNGEWADPLTKVPHLASVIACAAIVADAKACGKLIDDRPPAADMPALIEEAEAVILHVYAMNAGKNPRHWTIDDSETAAS